MGVFVGAIIAAAIRFNLVVINNFQQNSPFHVAGGFVEAVSSLLLRRWMQTDLIRRP
jgi:fluoride ion exporter CrcB/FEX